MMDYPCGKFGDRSFYRLQYVFTTCDPVIYYLWPFDLIFTGGQGLIMDYPCAKFDDFIFSRFGLSCRQTDRQNRRQTRMLNLLTRPPSAGVNIVLHVYSFTCNGKILKLTWPITAWRVLFVSYPPNSYSNSDWHCPKEHSVACSYNDEMLNVQSDQAAFTSSVTKMRPNWHWLMTTRCCYSAPHVESFPFHSSRSASATIPSPTIWRRTPRSTCTAAIHTADPFTTTSTLCWLFHDWWFVTETMDITSRAVQVYHILTGHRVRRHSGSTSDVSGAAAFFS